MAWRTILMAAAMLAAAGCGPRAPEKAAEPAAPEKLGATERYGLSDAEIAALPGDALVRRALERSDVETFDAASAEDTLSLGLLCLAQYYGEGVAQDATAAAATCARGAAANAPASAYVLSLMTRAGEGGIVADAAKADALLKTAADAGDARALHATALAQAPRAPTTARANAEKCAAQGYADCRFLLAQMLAAGRGGPKDIAGARAAYEALAADFHGPATRELGKLWRDGAGVPNRNIEEAVTLFRRAAVLDDGEASFLLGQLAEAGDGVPKEEALGHYEAAREDGYAPADAAIARLKGP
jgi:TPR repeat protein